MEVKSAFILSPNPSQPAAKRPPPPLRRLALNNEYEYNQRDANQYVNLLLPVALHASGDVSAHHQEHLTAFAASRNVHQCRYRLAS